MKGSEQQAIFSHVIASSYQILWNKWGFPSKYPNLKIDNHFHYQYRAGFLKTNLSQKNRLSGIFFSSFIWFITCLWNPMAGSERSFSATSYAENCVFLAGVGNETQARDLLSLQRLSEEVVDIKQTSRGSRDCVVLFRSFSS